MLSLDILFNNNEDIQADAKSSSIVTARKRFYSMLSVKNIYNYLINIETNNKNCKYKLL